MTVYSNSTKMHGVPGNFATATPVDNGMQKPSLLNVGDFSNGGSEVKAAAKWNDVPFAILFWAHFALIAGIGFTSGIAEIQGTVEDASELDHKVVVENNTSGVGGDVIGGIVVCVLCGIVFSLLYVKLAISMGENLIHVGTKFQIGLFFFFGLIFMMSGSTIGGILCFICMAITMCWYRAVQSRIPFAGANLSVACSSIKNFPTIFFVNFACLIASFVWMMVWSLAMIGIVKPSQSVGVETDSGVFDSRMCTDFPYDGTTAECTQETTGCCYCDASSLSDTDTATGWKQDSCVPTETMDQLTYFGMLISFYWGSTVVSNVMHCVVAGTVATWWFKHDAGSSPVFDSFYRAMTTSFGSICLGSLLVAILKAIRQMLREAEKNKNAQVFLCVIQCLLGCVESLLEYFNRYAFCYVAIYGYDFKTAGRSVFDLFKKLGWTTIINDDLIETALSFGCVGTGFLTALVGWLFGHAIGVDSQYLLFMFIGGFISGFSMAQITLNVISSAVATVFVCFAENPASLGQIHPQESATLIGAWRQFHGDLCSFA
ncbi:hypothetical protein TrCOL_g588 [Triparma columacea]|uniref:Choline transporter-like protein n=1 Tax=Triparma columacea TaxID=722753 RepID=A0A9W7GG16_9STRA|nr:hypothetical protein TrCOL_g588 [Triparma columacea]